MSGITVIRCTEPDELFVWHPGEAEPQGVHVEVDPEDRTLFADYTASDNSVPEGVYHRRRLWFPIPPLSVDAANRLLDKVEPLAVRVCDGYDAEWNGNNHVGTYTADAQDAIEAIEDLVDETSPRCPWGEEDKVLHFHGGADDVGDPATDFGLCAESTDKEVAEIADKLCAEIAESVAPRTVVFEGVEDRLRDLRDQMRAEA